MQILPASTILRFLRSGVSYCYRHLETQQRKQRIIERSRYFLCAVYELIERFLMARLKPAVDPQLPHEQSVFRRNRSMVQRVVNPTVISKRTLKLVTKVTLSWWICQLRSLRHCVAPRSHTDTSKPDFRPENNSLHFQHFI